MQILYSRCCGIDVHKDSVTACVLVYSGSPEPEVRKKEFSTHFKALGNLRFWLFAQKVTVVALESGARAHPAELRAAPRDPRSAGPNPLPGEVGGRT